MLKTTMKFEDTYWIAQNDLGYTFGVGLFEKRWIGFALACIPDGQRMMIVFPECSDDVQLGMIDREKCIRLAGAIAQDDDHLYGGVTKWLVPLELRGDPEEFRCQECGELGYHDCGADDFDFSDN